MGETRNNQVDRMARSFDVSQYLLCPPTIQFRSHRHMSRVTMVEGRKLCTCPTGAAPITKADAAAVATEQPNF